MSRLFLYILCSGLWLPEIHGAEWAVARPKLVVVIVIDQFRADYISRFQNSFGKDGFKALLKDGAYFPFGEYDLLQCMTGPGHATVLTGAYPYQMGIPLNEWFNQKTHEIGYCVEDHEVKAVGGSANQPGVSPKNLIGTTVGDELKNIDLPGRVVAVSLKDRSAVLLGGHRADLAFWFDRKSEEWVSSTYYLKDGKLPAWLNTFNKSRPREKCDLAEACGVEVTTAAFRAAMEGEGLGTHESTDLIAISFSTHDFAGHKFGPNAAEMKAITLAEDKAIAQIRALVQRKVPGGLKNVLFVLTGDHGVAPKVDYLAEKGVAGGRISEAALLLEMNETLNKKYGSPKAGKWVVFVADFNFYLDEGNVSAAKLDMAKMENDIKEILIKEPGMAHVFTRSGYEARVLPPGVFARRIGKTYFRGRSGHVVGIQKPFFVNESKNAADHMTSYSYDRTVPIIFAGFGIRHGVFAGPAEVVDIAPTVSFLLGVVPPALSEGRVLTQALK